HPFKRFSPFKNAFCLPHVPIVTSINDIGIFGNACDDEVVEEDVDMNNLVSSYTIPNAPLTKFLKDHPKDQVIGSIETPVQTRQMTKINEEPGQAEKKKEPKQEYILIHICTTDPLISQGPKDNAVDDGKKATEIDESKVLDNGGQDDQVTR
nr:hypothetical protein [Tanacetum cinerariifolium]